MRHPSHGREARLAVVFAGLVGVALLDALRGAPRLSSIAWSTARSDGLRRAGFSFRRDDGR